MLKKENRPCSGPKRRNSFDITRDILKACLHGSNQTRIVYTANLNNATAKKYLKLCVEMKLLAKQRSNAGKSFTYYVTADGQNFLENYFKPSF